jgi:sortase system peptidoglycan-associated protein
MAMKTNVISVAKKVQVLLVVTVLAAGSGHVAADMGKEQMQEEESLWSSQDRGTGFGALLGAIAGGPPGLVLGAFGGSLIGRHEGMKEQLAQSQQELVLVKQQLMQFQQQALLEAQQMQDEQEVEQETASMVASAQPVSMALPVDPLSMIEEGFSMTIHFRTGSHYLEDHYREQLTRLSQQLVKLDGVNVQLHGYTDERGNEVLNRTLSEKRVCVISDYLQENGIEYDSIELYAHGEGVQLLTDSDAESMHFDRRVVITFSKQL